MTDAAFDQAFGRLEQALATLFSEQLQLSKSPVRRIGSAALPALAGPPDDPAVAVHIESSGGYRAHTLLLFSPESARRLAASLLGERASTEEVLDACAEVGNIVASSFLSGLADHGNQAVLPSAPQVTVDMAGAVIASVVASGADLQDIPVVDLQFTLPQSTLQVLFLVLENA